MPRPKKAEAATSPATKGVRRAGSAPPEPELAGIVAAAVQELGALTTATHAQRIQYYWHLGKLARRISVKHDQSSRPSGVRVSRFGTGRIAKSLRIDQATVKAAGYFFDAFPDKAKLSRLAKLRRADGKPLSYWTIALLCAPALKDRREELLRRACAENWSEDDAKSALKAGATAGPAIARSGGRPTKAPRHLGELLARWQREDRTYLRYLEDSCSDAVIAGLLGTEPAAPIDTAALTAVTEDGKRVLAAIAHRNAILKRIEAHDRQVRATPASEAPGEVILGMKRPVRRVKRKP